MTTFNTITLSFSRLGRETLKCFHCNKRWGVRASTYRFSSLKLFLASKFSRISINFSESFEALLSKEISNGLFMSPNFSPLPKNIFTYVDIQLNSFQTIWTKGHKFLTRCLPRQWIGESYSSKIDFSESVLKEMIPLFQIQWVLSVYYGKSVRG